MPLGGQDCHHADNGPHGAGGEVGDAYLPGTRGSGLEKIWELVRREAAAATSAPLPE